MSTWRSKLAMVMVISVTASTWAWSPPALARPGEERLARPPAGAPALPAPETFVPAPPTLTADDASLLAEAPVPGSSSSLRRPGQASIAPSERTTAMSRHTVDRDGKGTAELYLKPAFRRKAGRWVDIDSTLRPSADPARPIAAEGALRPARFGSSAGRIVELGLDQGPVTLSSPGLKLSRPALDANVVT